MPIPSALVWIDLEMTGLEPDRCAIIEIASVVTTAQLEIVAQGPDIVVHQSDDVLAGMNEWCVEQHGASGLTEQVRASTISQSAAEAQTIAFLSEHVEAGTAPLCGNSVDLDWNFIAPHMPALAKFLSGEIVDVTTIKELVKRWYPNSLAPPKKGSHRALDDVIESIVELRHYRDHAFREKVPS